MEVNGIICTFSRVAIQAVVTVVAVGVKDHGAYYRLRGQKRFGGLNMLKTKRRTILCGSTYILEIFWGCQAP